MHMESLVKQLTALQPVRIDHRESLLQILKCVLEAMLPCLGHMLSHPSPRPDPAGRLVSWI
jgi:hypothetical protein